MASNFTTLESFEGVDFKRWQKKMHFLLFSMSVVYVLTTPMPEDGCDNPTLNQVRRRAKWENDDYVCKRLILNGMSNFLFDIYQNVETSKELWDTLEAKYMVRMPQEKLTLVEWGSHLRIEDSLMAQDNNKPKGNNVAGPLVVNMVEHNNSSIYNDNKGKHKHHDTKDDPNKKQKVTCWKCGKPRHLKKDYKAGNVGNKANGSGTTGSWDGSSISLKGHVYFKRMQDMSKDGLIPAFDMDTKKCKTCMLTKITKKPFQYVKRETEILELIHSDLCDLHATPLLGNKKYFVKFIDDAFRDVIFDENKFSLVSRPCQMSLVNEIEDSSGLVVPEKVTDEDDPKIFDEAMKSQDVAFWKEAINDEMDSIMGNNTWVLADLPPAADKEAEWLKNLLLKIPLWVKPIAFISIRCDSAATLAMLIARCTIGSLDT
nr:zinc finger, CCHC-type [Tanacetum cinerariifolium]